MAKFYNDASFSVVSNIFIEEYLPEANAEFVRVYLYALSHCGEDIANSEIASKLKILESDVIKAWEYWEGCGLVFREDGIVFKEVRHKTKEVKAASKKLSRSEVTELLRVNEELRVVNEFVQNLLGKMLTPTELSSLCWMYDELSLPANVIMMLIQYCVGEGKSSIKYMEKVAISWKEKGIDTSEMAEDYLKRIEKSKKAEGKIKAILNIKADRDFSESERKYIDRWIKELALPLDVISMAYDQTMINTGKLSWAYLNTVLANWHKNGLTTAERVKKSISERASRKENKVNNFTGGGGSVDVSEIERKAQQRLKKEMEES